MWSALQDQAYLMLPFFHCNVKRQMTVHIHTLKMLSKRKERNEGAKWTWISGKFLLCADYIQYLLLPRDLPERTPPETSREIRNSEVIM